MLLALLASTAAFADAPDNWKFSLDGYYRVRGYAFYNLFEGQAAPGTYMTHRIRMQPGLNFEDRAKFFMTLNLLDGVVFGDNESLASTALFAGDPSYTGVDGLEVDPIKLSRVWMEFKVPVGLLRVGRQSSNWGMGLLANGGDGFDDTFGENQYGSTYDRVIFATRPITVATTIANMVSGGKTKVQDVPLIAAVGVDRLVEDPLIQYYGYSCDATQGGDDPRCAGDEDHGFTVERDPENRSSTWWVDGEDDVWEMVYVLRYSGEGLHLGGDTLGDITAGVYAVNRQQAETDSNVWILDGYTKVSIKNVYFEGEILHIGGDTHAITLADSDTVDPLEKKADIWGYVVKGGYQSKAVDAIFEHGYASGDQKVNDKEFTGRPLHPDYNAGLLLYEEILARVTADTWSEDAKGLWSNGGIYNSRYIFPTVKARPAPNWEIIGGFLVAWPDKPDGVRILCGTDDKVDCASPIDSPSAMLGYEADLAVKHKFHDHINFTLEGGWAHATNRLPLKNVGLAYETDDDGKEYGNYFTIQSRIAYEF